MADWTIYGSALTPTAWRDRQEQKPQPDQPPEPYWGWAPKKEKPCPKK